MKNFRVFLSLVSAIALLTQTGCMTYMMQGVMPDEDTVNARTLIFEDYLLATAKPNDPNIQGLVFVGEKHSYLLTTGYEEIESLSNSLDGEHLLVNYTTNIIYGKQQTSEYPIQLTATDTGFEGVILISFLRHSGDYTTTELETLKRLGFSRGETPGRLWGTNLIFNKQIRLEGTAYKAVPNVEEIKKKFSRQRSIQFYSKAKTITVSNTGKKLLALPLWLMVDAVTLPFQLVYIPLVYLNTHKNSVD